MIRGLKLLLMPTCLWLAFNAAFAMEQAGKAHPENPSTAQSFLVAKNHLMHDAFDPQSGQTYFMQVYLLNGGSNGYYIPLRGELVRFLFDAHTKRLTVYGQNFLDNACTTENCGTPNLEPLASFHATVWGKAAPAENQTAAIDKRQFIRAAFFVSDDLYQKLNTSSLYLPSNEVFDPASKCNSEFLAQTNLATGEIILSGTMVAPPPANNKDRHLTNNRGHFVITFTPYEPADPDFGEINYDANAGSFTSDRLYDEKEHLFAYYKAKVNLKQRPIRYYLAPNFPEQYKVAVQDALNYWNQVLGDEYLVLAGEISAEQSNAEIQRQIFSLRHNIIQWRTYPSWGSATGHTSLVINPQNGEIFKQIITLTISTSYADFTYDFYSQPKFAKLPWHPFSKMDETLFVSSAQLQQGTPQSLASTVKGIIRKRVLQDFSLDHIRSTIAHEIGHGLGLRHNFAANLGGNLNGRNIFSLMHTYIYQLLQKHLPAPMNFTLPAQDQQALRAAIPSSSLLDYFDTETDLLVGHRLGIMGEEAQQKVDPAKRLPPLAYDVAMIRELYFQEEQDQNFLFCSDLDEDNNVYANGRKHDSFGDALEYQLWSTQRSLQRDIYWLAHSRIMRDGEEHEPKIDDIYYVLRNYFRNLSKIRTYLHPDQEILLADEVPDLTKIQNAKFATLQRLGLEPADIFFNPIMPVGIKIPLIEQIRQGLAQWNALTEAANRLLDAFNFDEVSAEYDWSSLTIGNKEFPWHDLPPAKEDWAPVNGEVILAQTFYRRDNSKLPVKYLEQRPIQWLYASWSRLFDGLKLTGYPATHHATWYRRCLEFSRLLLFSRTSVEFPQHVLAALPANSYVPYFPEFIMNPKEDHINSFNDLRATVLGILNENFFGPSAASLAAQTRIDLATDLFRTMAYLRIIERKIVPNEDISMGDRADISAFIQEEALLLQALITLPSGAHLELPFDPRLIILPAAAHPSPEEEEPAQG